MYIFTFDIVQLEPFLHTIGIVLVDRIEIVHIVPDIVLVIRAPTFARHCTISYSLVLA